MLILMEIPDGTSFQARFDYLGYVEEGDQIHVVARAHTIIGDHKSSSLQVITMRQHEGGWLAMLSGDIQSFIDLMRTLMVDE